MELIKKNIHMNKLKGKMVNQITLDDDMVVPDKFPDVRNKITEDGGIMVESVKVSPNKVNVIGKLNFKMMYKAVSSEDGIHRLDGSIPFDENINMGGIEEGDTINVDFDVDDLTISVINSRKISIKAIITVTVMAETLRDEEIAVDMESENAECIKDNLDITQIAIRKKDLLRIREEIDLGAGRMNINEVIWNTASLVGTQIKVMEGKINISGEIIIFVLYTAEEGPIQWVDANVPFNGMIEVPSCYEDMIPSIELKLSAADIEAKPDYDGEQRLLQLDGIINVDIKLYEEQHLSVLKDVYSRERELLPVTGMAEYENLLMKNVSKCRAGDKIKVNLDNSHIMQICSCHGDIRLDDISVAEDGLMAEGVIDVSVLYICSDDSNPLCCVRESIPFSHKIEVSNINENCVFKIRSMIEQLNCIMTGSDEMEVKAVLILDCIVFDKISREIIVDVEEHDYDMERISQMPAIVGYVVQRGDTLWNIAKKFYTTVDSLKEINEIKNGEPVPGEMIIAVKKMA